AISLRPQSASARSATLKSVKLRVSVAAFIGHSIVGDRATGKAGDPLVIPCAGTVQRARLRLDNPEPGSGLLGEPPLQRSSGTGILPKNSVACSAPGPGRAATAPPGASSLPLSLQIVTTAMQRT